MKPCGCDVKRPGGAVLCLDAGEMRTASRVFAAPGFEAQEWFRKHTGVWPEDVRKREEESE